MSNWRPGNEVGQGGLPQVMPEEEVDFNPDAPAKEETEDSAPEAPTSPEHRNLEADAIREAAEEAIRAAKEEMQRLLGECCCLAGFWRKLAIVNLEVGR